jgi:hypothetical protein
MSDPWCKRLAIIAAVWLVLAIALQVMISLVLH